MLVVLFLLVCSTFCCSPSQSAGVEAAHLINNTTTDFVLGHYDETVKTDNYFNNVFVRNRTKRDASCCAHRNACVAFCAVIDKCLTGYCDGYCGTCNCRRCLFRG